MRNKFQQIGIFLFITMFLFSITLIVADLMATNKRTENIKGKIVLTMTTNGESIDQKMGGISILLSGNYIVEYNRLIQSSVWDSTNQKVITFQPGDSGYIVLENYAVTDMTAGVVVQFDTNLVSPSVVRSMPERKKTRGYMPDGKKEIDIVTNVISGFNYEKDTTVDKVKYKLISYSKREPVKRSIILERGVAYLDPEKKDFPIKVSHYLDNKYGGWVNRLDLWLKDTTSGRKEVIVTMLRFSPKLDKHEQYVIDRLIPATKAYLDTAKIER